MRKLMSADWYMLRKHGMIWWLCLCVVGLGVFVACAAVYHVSQGWEVDFEPSMFGIGSVLTGAAAAILCGTFLDNAFREGTIRNKVTTGSTRGAVYWSSYVTLTLASLLIFACYEGLLLACMYIWQGQPEDPVLLQTLILYALCTVPAYTALYCMIGAVGGRRGVGIACFVVFCALGVLSFWLQDCLWQPKMLDEYMWEGDFPVVVGQYPNPDYLAMPARAVYQFFYNLLPPGQSIQCLISIEAVLPWYALLFGAAACTIGAVVFKRRNIS